MSEPTDLRTTPPVGREAVDLDTARSSRETGHHELDCEHPEMSREILGRQWERDGLGQILRHDLGVKREEERTARHPRSGWNVPVGVNPGSPVGGSEPPVQEVHDYGHLPNRANGGMRPNTSQRPIKHIYRGVSEGEYQNIQRTGAIQSDGRGNVADGEGTVASHSARAALYYARTSGASGPGTERTAHRVLKIAVHPDDGWKVDPVDQYIKTDRPVPASRIVRVTRSMPPVPR